MNALVWKAFSLMEMDDSPKPNLLPGWVLIEVRYSGICGSDIATYLGHNDLRRPPLILGHEFPGTIVELGADVPKEWANQLVAVNPQLSCGQCRRCRQGLRQHCPSRRAIGGYYPGSYADYVAVPFTACYRVNDPVKGALAEPLACALRVAGFSHVDVGGSVMVIGAGTIGLLVTRVLKAKGVDQCIVVDTNPARLPWATNWGATSVLNPKTEDLAAFVKKATMGESVDCVVDAVGSGDTRVQAVENVCRGGRVVLIGIHENLSTLPGNDIVTMEKEIVGSFAYTDEDFRRAVALANGNFLETSSGWLDVRSLKLGQSAFKEQSTGSAPYSKILLQSK